MTSRTCPFPERRLTRLVALALGLLVSPCGAVAQSVPPGSGGGGGGGFRSGSGSSLSSKPPQFHEESFRHETGGGRLTPLTLAADPGIQAELALDPGQKQRLEGVFREVRAAERGLADRQAGTPNQRIERIQARQREVAAIHEDVLRDMNRAGDAIEKILNPEQVAILRVWQAADRAAAARKSPRPGTKPQASAGVSLFGPDGKPLPAGPGDSSTSSSSTSYNSGGEPGSVVHALRRPDAPAALALSPDQTDRIRAEMQAFQKAELDSLARFQKFQGAGMEASKAERAEVMAAGAAANEAARQGQEKVRGILSPGQWMRLEEIILQAEGSAGLLKPDTIKALKLTASQQARIAAARQETERQVRSALAFGPGQPPNEAAFRRADALRAGSEQRLVATLTPEQQAAWRKLQGRPYAGIELLRNPPGGGGGGGGNTGFSHGAAR